MKSKSVAKLVVHVISVALLCLALPSPSLLAEKLVIQVYSVTLRATPSYMGPGLGELKNKQEVTSLGKQGAFTKVKAGKLEGWIPSSALIAEKKLKIKEGNEVMLSKPAVMSAGKGLGSSAPGDEVGGAPSAEELRRVDEMEKATKVGDDDAGKFKASGNLKSGQRNGKSK